MNDTAAKRFSIAVVENEQHQILFLLRAPDREFAPSRWGFPAGHIEQGETPGECINRELSEEIGHHHRIRLLKELGPIRDPLFGGTMEVHLYHFRWITGEIVINEEHTEYCWLGLKEFQSLQLAPGVVEDLRYLDLLP